MPPLTEDELADFAKKFNEQNFGKNTYSFNWSGIYNRPPYESTFTPKPTAEKAWLEIVIFVSPWNTKVECSRSDGKMMSKEIDRRGLRTLFIGLASRGMVSQEIEHLNVNTTIYRFRKET